MRFEKTALNGGILPDTVIRRCETTGEEALRGYADKLFRGLSLSGTVGTRGFVARSVCPADGISHYPGSSRDQYTDLIFGLWRFYRTSLSNEEQKACVRRVFFGYCRAASS